ncbi:MAG: DUF1292 domain-containing protein [Lachnospiraceae bacterium]|nr:DUF1292 domain-containing protein [Lachnospiraceae bacterium]MBQ7506367.1 DUF1292 domain-containing protein [Lachnospiraceae bacterium]
MEKIEFLDPEGGETLRFFVVEKTVLQGEEYLLVTEGETEEDDTAYVLRKTGEEGPEEALYEFVEDEKVLNAVAPLFSALLEDADTEVLQG